MGCHRSVIDTSLRSLATCQWQPHLGFIGVVLARLSSRPRVSLQAQPGIPPLAVRQMYDTRADGSIGGWGCAPHAKQGHAHPVSTLHSASLLLLGQP